jgi:hypothetical protein
LIIASGAAQAGRNTLYARFVQLLRTILGSHQTIRGAQVLRAKAAERAVMAQWRASRTG